MIVSQFLRKCLIMTSLTNLPNRLFSLHQEERLLHNYLSPPGIHYGPHPGSIYTPRILFCLSATGVYFSLYPSSVYFCLCATGAIWLYICVHSSGIYLSCYPNTVYTFRVAVYLYTASVYFCLRSPGVHFCVYATCGLFICVYSSGVFVRLHAASVHSPR